MRSDDGGSGARGREVAAGAEGALIVEARRILYVQATAEVGGSEVCLLRLVGGLDPARYRAYVALPKDGPLNGAFLAAGAEVLLEPSMMRLSTRLGAGHYLRYVLHYPRAVWRLSRFLRRERIDLVHTNTLHALHGFAAAALAARPHVWHVREIVLQSRAMRRVELALARRFSHRIVAMSRAIAGMFGGHRLPRNLNVIHEGVDLQRFHPANDGNAVRAELGISADAPVAGVVCRLDHWKGVDVFLRAAARCLRSVPDARFVVAGGIVEGREDVAAGLVRLVRSLGIEEAVRFSGWTYGPERIPSVHAALDVLVLPSVWPEPFGLVVLEAMATGKPVIATRHGGPEEMLVEGEDGLYVEPGDDEGLARAMTELFRDRKRRERMGRAARTHAERDFDHERYFREVQQVYDEVLG